MNRRLDPDRLLAIEEERDFLLASLDDLEAEHSAGDLDDHDYTELKDDYTVRAADAIRSIDEYRAEIDASNPVALGRRLGLVAGLLVFAVGAGWLLAQATGERGARDEISGQIDETPRQQLLRCQTLGVDDLVAALACYDEVLAEDPQNVEALTYRGWFLVLTTGSAQASGDEAAARELLDRAQDNLDRAVEIDPSYPDARAFRAIVFDRLGEVDNACAELETLNELNAPPLMQNLVAPLSQGLACPS